MSTKPQVLQRTVRSPNPALMRAVLSRQSENRFRSDIQLDKESNAGTQGASFEELDFQDSHTELTLGVFYAILLEGSFFFYREEDNITTIYLVPDMGLTQW